jgi:hypothetical protein
MTIQALHWDRGRLARLSTGAQISQKDPVPDLLFALRAHGGRDARGPSNGLLV